MKKIVFMLAAVALILVLLMPYITGRAAQTVSYSAAEQFNNNPQQYGKLDIKQYQRGYRSTNFSFTWSPYEEASRLVQESIAFNCKASHGILVFSYDCGAENLPNYSAFVADKLNGFDPLKIGGEVSLLGNITQRVRVVEFEFTSEDGATVAVLPGEFSIQSDYQLSSFDINGDFDGVSWSTKEGDVKIGEIKVTGSLARNKHNLLIGEVALMTEQLAAKNNSETDNMLSGIALSVKTKEEGENLTLDNLFSIDQFSQSGGLATDEFTDLQFALSLSGINMAQLMVVIKELQDIGQNQAKSSKNALKLAVLPEIASLLKTGFRINSNVSADDNAESLDGEFQLQLADNLLLGDFLLLALNPQAILSKVEASAVSQVPKSMVEKNPQRQTSFATSPWYVESTRAYESNFQLHNGQLSLNGEALTLEELMSLLSQ